MYLFVHRWFAVNPGPENVTYESDIMCSGTVGTHVRTCEEPLLMLTLHHSVIFIVLWCIVGSL